MNRNDSRIHIYVIFVIYVLGKICLFFLSSVTLVPSYCIRPKSLKLDTPKE